MSEMSDKLDKFGETLDNLARYNKQLPRVAGAFDSRAREARCSVVTGSEHDSPPSPIFRVWWRGNLMGTDVWANSPEHVDTHVMLSRTGRVYWYSHVGLEDITDECRVEFLANGAHEPRGREFLPMKKKPKSPTKKDSPASLAGTAGSTDTEALLQMLKWLVGFHQPGDAKAVIDGEPINQARRLINRVEGKRKPNTPISHGAPDSRKL